MDERRGNMFWGPNMYQVRVWESILYRQKNFLNWLRGAIAQVTIQDISKLYELEHYGCKYFPWLLCVLSYLSSESERHFPWTGYAAALLWSSTTKYLETLRTRAWSDQNRFWADGGLGLEPVIVVHCGLPITKATLSFILKKYIKTKYIVCFKWIWWG